MHSSLKVVLLTLGLMIVGCITAASAAVGTYALAIWLTTGRWGFPFLGSPFILAIVAGVLGALLLPSTSWLLLRRVPLARTVAGTVLGAVLGGLAGWGVMLLTRVNLAPLAGGVVGFFAAAFALRSATMRGPRAGHIAPTSLQRLAGPTSTGA